MAFTANSSLLVDVRSRERGAEKTSQVFSEKILHLPLEIPLQMYYNIYK